MSLRTAMRTQSMDEPAKSAAALLSVRDLAARIGGREVLSAVNLDVERGESIGVVGETGSGKTLTCRAIMGLLPRLGGEITGGEIRFNGRDLGALSQREWHRLRGRELALVPQSSLSGLDPIMTVGRQLAETIRLLAPGVDARVRGLELLEMVQMPNAANTLKSYPHELSGGMRQRVMIALALAGRPKLLVADEPTTALDVTVQDAILQLIDGLRRSFEMSLMIVTHDIGVIEAVSDKVAIMYAGMTVETGETAEVLSRPQHPYTRALLAARPSARQPGERLATIPGLPPVPADWSTGCRFRARCPFALDACGVSLPRLAVLQGAHAAACIRQEELARG